MDRELEEKLDRIERRQKKLEQLLMQSIESGSEIGRFLAMLNGEEVPDPKAQKAQGKAALVLRKGHRKARRS